MDLSVLQCVPTWVIALTILLGLFYYYLTSNFGYLEKQGVKTAKPWPIIGSLSLRKPKHVADFYVNLYKKFGRFYGLYEGSTPVLHVAHPELIKKVCVKDFSVFPHQRAISLGDEDDKSFLTALTGEKWKAVRNLMTPFFTSGKLKLMTHLIEDCCKTLIQELNKFAESGEPLEAKKCMSSYTLDVIALCAFGTKTNSMADPDNAFIANTRKIVSLNFSPKIFIIFFLPKLAKYLNLQFFPKDSYDFFRDVCTRVIEMRKNEKDIPRDFLTLLLEAEIEENNTQMTTKDEGAGKEASADKKKVLNKDMIIAQSILFLLTGYATTATILSFSFYELAKNPDVQEKLAEEVLRVTSKHDQLSYEAIAEMLYLDMVVSETLRIYPPATRIERTCVEDGYELGGVILKKGMLVGIPVFCIHHDPEYYPDPEKFDPERFSAENKATRDPFIYLPFGAGPRNCIAMRFALLKIKMTLAAIIKEFVIKTCPQTEETFEYYTVAGLLQPQAVTVAIEKRVNKVNQS